MRPMPAIHLNWVDPPFVGSDRCLVWTHTSAAVLVTREERTVDGAPLGTFHDTWVPGSSCVGDGKGSPCWWVPAGPTRLARYEALVARGLPREESQRTAGRAFATAKRRAEAWVRWVFCYETITVRCYTKADLLDVCDEVDWDGVDRFDPHAEMHDVASDSTDSQYLAVITTLIEQALHNRPPAADLRDDVATILMAARQRQAEAPPPPPPASWQGTHSRTPMDHRAPGPHAVAPPPGYCWTPTLVVPIDTPFDERTYPGRGEAAGIYNGLPFQVTAWHRTTDQVAVYALMVDGAVCTLDLADCASPVAGA